jgi:5-methylcytosine-specific restriction endonuclease McrA
MRKKLPSLASLRKKTDKLLTPWVIGKKKLCEACGSKATVAHHWIEKSRSSNLRYNYSNLIALCAPCHVKIHNRFGNSVTGAYDIATKIINKRGKKWKYEMDVEGRKIIKTDRAFYEENYNRICKS